MPNIIEIRDQNKWSRMNSLKSKIKLLDESVTWMHGRNSDGKFDIAIKEEGVLLDDYSRELRSFFDTIRGKTIEADLSQAA